MNHVILNQTNKFLCNNHHITLWICNVIIKRTFSLRISKKLIFFTKKCSLYYHRSTLSNFMKKLELEKRGGQYDFVHSIHSSKHFESGPMWVILFHIILNFWTFPALFLTVSKIFLSKFETLFSLKLNPMIQTFWVGSHKSHIDP